MRTPVRIRLSTFLPLMVIFAVLWIAAYVQWARFGLPSVPDSPHFTPETATQPYGFADWIRITHYVNLLFMVLLVRSGLQILMDHPRLYWNVHGALLRLRAETQLGFKMVKWIEAIEFAKDVKHVYKGEGGYAEDNEFFDSMADI